jgi:hypothetical protein
MLFTFSPSAIIGPKGLAAVLLLGAGASAQQNTARVSVDSAGNQANGGSSLPSISDDGRWTAFDSTATNLVAGDTNGKPDVFVHDALTGVTVRASAGSSGTQANGDSSGADVSGDGRYVAFQSLASNLVSGDANGDFDVFVRDMQTGITELASVDSSGNQANSWSYGPVISADGRYVAFYSTATNLVAGANGQWQAYVHDRQTGATEPVSVDSSGNLGNNASYPEELTGDGRYVVFDSLASNLVAGDTNASWDVFVRDRLTGLTERVSVDSSEGQGNAPSQGGSISGDGRYVCFDSVASNLVAGDTNGLTDVFVRDRQAGTTERVSVDSSENQAVFGNSLRSSISQDGRYVAFDSQATNLVTGGSGWVQVFVRDRQAGTTEIASIDTAGNHGNQNSSHASISADGGRVAFHSSASNLVPGDTNAAEDVFVRDRSCSDQFVNYCTAGISASGCVVRLRSNGIASASAPSGFVVIADYVEGSKDGILFFGQNGKQANPWGNGTSFQCVVPPVRRGGVLPGNGTNGVCNGFLSQDLNARWCPTCPKPHHAPAAGKPLQIQLWYRDPLSTSNQTTSFSDAIEVGVCP